MQKSLLHGVCIRDRRYGFNNISGIYCNNIKGDNSGNPVSLNLKYYLITDES